MLLFGPSQIPLFHYTRGKKCGSASAQSLEVKVIIMHSCFHSICFISGVIETRKNEEVLLTYELYDTVQSKIKKYPCTHVGLF